VRILLVDRIDHKTTKSFDFFAALLRRRFEVETFYYDQSYRVSIPREKIDWADAIVYLEFLPSRFRIAEPGKRCVFVPMYDNEWGSRWQWKRIADSGMAVVSFCGRITEHARKCGVKNLLDVRYALPPSPAPGDPRVAVLWDRGQVGIDQIRKLFAPDDLDKLLLVRRPERDLAFEPVPEDFRTAYHVELHESGFLPDEEYRALLSEPGVYVAPRFKEGIGMTFLEALAAGKLVVAHRDATMDESIEDGVDGRLVDMRNPGRVALPATPVETRLERARQRHERWKADATRLLDFLNHSAGLPPCKGFWSPRSVFRYVLFTFEGIFFRLFH
jgi:glycosyltransferase involved in cell wall biosynthesis